MLPYPGFNFYWRNKQSLILKNAFITHFPLITNASSLLSIVDERTGDEMTETMKYQPGIDNYSYRSLHYRIELKLFHQS